MPPMPSAGWESQGKALTLIQPRSVCWERADSSRGQLVLEPSELFRHRGREFLGSPALPSSPNLFLAGVPRSTAARLHRGVPVQGGMSLQDARCVWRWDG